MCRKASVGMCSIKDVIIPINHICLLFDPAIPTSSFNFIRYNSMEHELGRFSELTCRWVVDFSCRTFLGPVDGSNINQRVSQVSPSL